MTNVLRPALLLLLVAVLTACECELKDCISGLTVDVEHAGLVKGDKYRIDICVDDVCETQEEFAGDGTLRGFVATQETAEATVTVTISDPDGKAVVDHSDTVEFERVQPNGQFCEPTCWNGEATIRD